MVMPASGLGRRLQLLHGSQWLYAANGDPYADVLRGFADDPYPAYERIRERGPLWRSRVGAWVTAHHRVGAELIDHPGLEALGPDGARSVLQPTPLEGVAVEAGRRRIERWRGLTGPLGDEHRDRVRAACQRVVDAVGDDFDLAADVAGDAAVEALGDLLVLPVGARERLEAACSATAIGLDGLLCPQRLPDTLRLLEAVEDLKSLFDGAAGDGKGFPAREGADAEDVRSLSVLLAVAGVPLAAGLVTGSVVAALNAPGTWAGLAGDDPAGTAAAVVDETRRWAPPVHLYPAVARTGLEVAGTSVEPGDQVVVAVAAANRDPEVFPEPARFDPGRPAGGGDRTLAPGHAYPLVAPFARAVAEETVRALADRFPRLRTAGPAMHRRRAPVTRAVLHLPVSAR
ncbi:P450-derived glycosyltransferase activator [Spirillospora sp. NPDC127200]